LKFVREIRVRIDLEYYTDIVNKPIRVGSLLAAWVEYRQANPGVLRKR